MANKNQGIVAVFDVDDTLIDSGAKLKADVVSAFSRLGRAISPEQVVGNWYNLAENYGISREQFDAAFDKRKSWEQSLRGGEVPIFPETYRVLEELKQRGIRTNVLSKSLPEYTHVKLRHLNLAPYFEQVVTVDPKSPSKREGALELMKKLGPETVAKAYFIGDKEEDVKIAEDVREAYGTPSTGIYINRKGNILNGYPSVNSLEGVLGVIENGR